MNRPYTYLIKCRPTNQVYYGVRFAEGCNSSELFETYFTSSKHVHNLIDEYGVGEFDFEIRREFDSVEQARNWETKVLRRCGAVQDSRFINKTDNISISPEACGWRKGIPSHLHNRFGSKNPKLSALNKNKTGKNNPMYGRRGPEAPCFGRTGEKHPMFGKSNPKASILAQQLDKCQVCGRVATRLNISRWHNNKCKKHIGD